MKGIRLALCWAALLPGLAGIAGAQNPSTISRPGERTFVDSQITLGEDYPPISNKTFVSMPVMQLKKGAVLPSKAVIGKLGMDRMLSLRQFDFAAGPRGLTYPVIGLMRCSNFSDTGSFVKVIASKTALRADAKAGVRARSDGFLIEARRDIRARETLPTVRVAFAEKYFIFSIEEAAQAKVTAPQATINASQAKINPPQTTVEAVKLQPLLTIAPEQASARDREIALEAWRLANQSVHEDILKAAQ